MWNFIFLECVEGIGIVSVEEVINWGLLGLMLWVFGVWWDFCKVDYYECYDEFDWGV